MAKSGRNGGGRDGEQIEVLRAIWQEMKALKASLENQLETTRRELGAHIDQTNARIEQTNARLDGLRQEVQGQVDGLRVRMTESEMRLATATTQLSGDVRELSGLIREWRDEHRAEQASDAPAR